MKRFGLIGAAGYIAPRHLKAIKETGNDLVASMDVNDSVGIMDSFFPDAEFFTEFEQFDSFIEDECLAGRKLDYMVVCSPNYLHLPHIKFALRKGIDVICEKPVVLKSAELEVIKKYELKYGATLSSILQLRLHPAILQLRDRVRLAPADKVFDVELTYLTSRGKWYLRSWKGFEHKSGGVATNIGVHFYDMLSFIFGKVQASEVHYRDNKTSAGYIKLEKARVRWFLSIDAAHLPTNAVHGEKSTYRSVTIEGEELEFSGGFNDLHTDSYKNIIQGHGFGVEENKTAINIVEALRVTDIIERPTSVHPLLARVTK